MGLQKAASLLVRLFVGSAISFLPFGNSSADNDNTWRVLNLGATVNTSDYEGFPTITRNGLALYFARASSRSADGSKIESFWDTENWDIYVTTRPSLEAPWGDPQRLPDHINTGGEEHSVSLSPDGHWMYFSSTELDSCGGLDIFRSYRDDTSDHLAWGKPENLGCEVNTVEHDVCVIFHQEDDTDLASLYFVSNREGTTGGLDTWRVGYNPQNGEYTEAENLLSVSSPEFDGHLDPESGYVWTTRDGGFGGSDIWHSTRDDYGHWDEPVNLGDSINTKFEEQLPSPFDDGRIIYFPSDRPGGNGYLDIYIAEKVFEY